MLRRVIKINFHLTRQSRAAPLDSLPMTHKLFLLVLSVLAHNFLSSSAEAREISVMSYNVENLFDTIDDPAVRDEEFLPGGRLEWTEEKMNEKMQNLSLLVRGIKNEDGSRCPDILALVEVENYSVLRDWNQRYLGECGYNHQNIVIYFPEEGERVVADQRGIKVALITKLDVGWWKPHLVYEGARHVLEVHLYIDDKPLVVFVNHWKSRRGGGEEKRLRSAKVLRDRMQAIMDDNPWTDIMAVGDFNDEPENKSMEKFLRIHPNRQVMYEDLDFPYLWNTSFNLIHFPATMAHYSNLLDDDELKDQEHRMRKLRGTYYFRRDKIFNALDHILLSRGLFDTEGFSYIENSFRVLRPKKFTDKIGAPIPYRPYEGGRVGGASDHFPIFSRLKFNQVDTWENW